MYHIHTFLGLLMAIGISGQLFDKPVIQLGFDFPGFEGPDAFEQEGLQPRLPGFLGIQSIQERMAELAKGQAKPRPGIKTKVKTKHEGHTNTTTIERKGKGFNSWERLTTFEDGDKNNKTDQKSFSKMVSSIFKGAGNIFGGAGIPEEKSKKSECSGQKPCPADKYCDPLGGVCKPRLPIGAACYYKEQCKKENDAICIWGRCSTGRPGQPGTFCKKDKDCIANSYCGEDSQFTMFHPICKPKLSEGASCGSASPLGVFKVIMGKRSVAEDDAKNPCMNGFKCEAVGLLGGMVCVPESLVTKPGKGSKDDDEQLKEADKEASSGDQETDEKDENNEGGDIVPSKEERKPEEEHPVTQEDKEDEDNKPEPEEDNEDEEEAKKPAVNPGQLPSGTNQKQPNNPSNPTMPQKKPPQGLPYPPPGKKGKKKKAKKAKKAEENEDED